MRSHFAVKICGSWILAVFVGLPTARGQDVKVDLSSLVGQRFILVGYTPGKKAQIKRKDLVKGVVGLCDIAVEINEASAKRGKLSIAFERIGTPVIAGRRNSCPSSRSLPGDQFIEITGFPQTVTPTDLLPLWNNILVTPEKYLDLRGEPVDQQALNPSTGDMVSPRERLRILPSYTDSARRTRASGDIVIEGIVGTDGLLHDARIVTSVHPDLDEQALKATSLYRFVPGQLRSKPVPTKVRVEVTFRLY